MRIALPLLVVPVVTCALASSSGAVPSLSSRVHRWERCGVRTVCATENGGRSWRRLLTVPLFDREYSADPSASQVVRWSSTAGLVVVQPHSYVLWTRDGGRRWFRTHAFETPNPSWCIATFPGPPYCTATLAMLPRKGGLYFDVLWLSDNDGCPTPGCHVQRTGTLHYRLEGWPPRRTPRCVSGWFNALHRLPKGLRPNGRYDPARKLKGTLPPVGNLCADDLWGADTLNDGLTAVEVQTIPPR